MARSRTAYLSDTADGVSCEIRSHMRVFPLIFTRVKSTSSVVYLNVKRPPRVFFVGKPSDFSRNKINCRSVTKELSRLDINMQTRVRPNSPLCLVSGQTTPDLRISSRRGEKQLLRPR